MLETILAILPSSFHSMIVKFPPHILNQLEEIRIRERRPLEITFAGEYRFVSPQGELLPEPEQAYLPTREDCERLLDLLTNHSLYTLEEELRKGFITIRGGHRVGISGRVVLEHGAIRQMKDIASFNIRLAKEIPGAGKAVLPFLLDPAAQSVYQTLIISPPQRGKTTLARDLARLISYGEWPGLIRWGGKKVGIVDERSELAACRKGVPKFDLGPRTDVLDGCPKAEGMMMMIRSMSPDVLVVDEIGRREDAVSIHEAIHAGIRVIATAHGRGLEDVAKRPILAELLADSVFSRFVVMKGRGDPGALESVLDQHGHRLERQDQISVLPKVQ